MKRTPLIVIALVLGCGSKEPPAVEEPVEPPGPVEDATGPDATQDGEPGPDGVNVWEVHPDAPHGQCCTSDEECGPITCEPYEYATESCQKVCTYSCKPGDMCPQLGGTLDPPPPCPQSGLCPVGPPWV